MQRMSGEFSRPGAMAKKTAQSPSCSGAAANVVSGQTAVLTPPKNGTKMARKFPQLSLKQVYPALGRHCNLNTCGDPDCGNFGVAPDFTIPSRKGGASIKTNMLASTAHPSLAKGLGRYYMGVSGRIDDHRMSTVFECARFPKSWVDARSLQCQHMRGNGTCDISFSVLSNVHLDEEVERLRHHNGVLLGPACGACGRRYLDAPDEFIFNGAHGKETASRSATDKPTGVRLIHKPCKGKKGARFAVYLDHQKQQDTTDNVALLRAIVNGAGINDLARLLADPRTGKKCGMSRIYARIFWLERVLLSFERAQLAKWRAKKAKTGDYLHARIAHDDVVLSVNWETSEDRRITALNCSVSADIRSGYVFRIDVDFDPRVDPAAFFESAYLDQAGEPTNLQTHYQQASGWRFDMPSMHFQRPSGRLDEAAFFASCASQWQVFHDRLAKSIVAGGAPQVQAAASLVAQAKERIALIDEIRNGYFDLPANDRDIRNTFTGIMTRDTYTKAAHLVCLREMLPFDRLTIVGEKEGALARVMPHVFEEDINADRFEWHVVSFDKAVTKPEMMKRVEAYKKAFETFRNNGKHPLLTPLTKESDALRLFVDTHMSPYYLIDRFGTKLSTLNPNFQGHHFPQLWLNSPIQSAGETDKHVGFPILRSELRQKLKQCQFDQMPVDAGLRLALARRVAKATLQPTSSFMNSLRERISFARRAGGRATRVGPSFINGASFSPRVLISVVNIYRVYYNWFEARQYVSASNKGQSRAKTAEGVSSIRVPGTSEVIQVQKRRQEAPVLRTPAMRMGLQAAPKPGARAAGIDPHRVLYRPWLYYGTPLWTKFESRHPAHDEDDVFSFA